MFKCENLSCPLNTIVAGVGSGILKNLSGQEDNEAVFAGHTIILHDRVNLVV